MEDRQGWQEPRFSTDGMPPVLVQKLQPLLQLLAAPLVDLKALKAEVARGVPDEAPLLREYAWKLLLGYLPPERAKWAGAVERQEEAYRGLLRTFLPESKFEGHPLWLRRGHPRRQQLEQDCQLWEQIEKDTSRTHAEIGFFARKSAPILVPYFTAARRQKFRLVEGEDEAKYRLFLEDRELQRQTYRFDYMSRILYVFARLNPRILYVQGMNEILAPIFYLVNSNKDHVEEAACFFMFNQAISHSLELHIEALDASHNGIRGRLQQVEHLLRALDPPLAKRLLALRLDPFFYCFRWVTLLFAQDFPLFDTIRLWESIFAAPVRPHYVALLAVSLLLANREFLLEHDFAAGMARLQNVSQHVLIPEVIANADRLAQEHPDFLKLVAKGQRRAERARLKREQRGAGEGAGEGLPRGSKAEKGRK